MRVRYFTFPLQSRVIQKRTGCLGFGYKGDPSSGGANDRHSGLKLEAGGTCFPCQAHIHMHMNIGGWVDSPETTVKIVYGEYTSKFPVQVFSGIDSEDETDGEDDSDIHRGFTR